MSETRVPYGGPTHARLTRQGQITVPKAVREALGAMPGDELLFELHDGDIVVRHRPRRSVLAYAGMAADTAPSGGLTPAELTDSIEREVGEAYQVKLARMLPAKPEGSGRRTAS